MRREHAVIICGKRQAVLQDAFALAEAVFKLIKKHRGIRKLEVVFAKLELVPFMHVAVGY